MAKKKAKPSGTNGAPKKKTKPDWAPHFLSSLASTANILAACREAKVARSKVYRRRDSDKAFESAMADALDDAVDELELEARRRALHGLRRVKFHQGAPIMIPLLRQDGTPAVNEAGELLLTPYVEHEYSDVLAMFLLKAHRPEKYREKVEHQHTGQVVHTLEYTRPAPSLS